MKYTVKFMKEVTTVIHAATIVEALRLTEERMFREQNCKLLSIEVIKEGEAAPPKNPTPFDRPPSGTPGAGQMRIDDGSHLLMAKAA